MGRVFLIAYCLVVISVLLRPHMILADPEIPAPVVTKATRFDILPDSPDPNQVFERINQTRMNHGLPALVADSQLANLAVARAKDMMARHYFARKNPDGQYYYNLPGHTVLNTGNSCENLSVTFVPEQDRFLGEWSGSLGSSGSCVMNPGFRQAGYAVAKILLKDYDGNLNPAYLVVGIHSGELSD